MLSRISFFFAGLVLLTHSSWAADAPPLIQGSGFTAPYDIEVVIFEQFGQDGGEYWPDEPGTPDTSLAVGSLTRAGSQGQSAIVLSREQGQLGPAAYTLRRKGAVIHAHQLWRQDVKGRRSNTWYHVGSNRMNGLVRISRGRYLHLDTDLLLRSADAGQLYRVQLHRRMRSGETHYVDHPKLGILIRAEKVQVATSTPLEPEPELPDAPGPEVDPGEQRGPTPGSLPRAMPDPS